MEAAKARTKIEGTGGKDVRRGLRRHHRFRMRRHAARLIHQTWSLPEPHLAWIRHLVLRRGDTFVHRTGTARYGNPRRTGKVTRRELLAQRHFEEQWKELPLPTEAGA